MSRSVLAPRVVLRSVTAIAFAASAVLSSSVPTAFAVVDGPNSLDLRATYDVDARINWKARRLIVSSTAHVRNTTNDPVDDLTFNLVPARIGALVLESVKVDGADATRTVDDQSIVVHLPDTLGVDEETDVAIDYRATFKTNGTDKNWLFARIDGYATAYRWIPWLSRPTQFNRSNIGDPFTTSVSPRVDVTITTSRQLGLATTGRRTSVSGNGLVQTFVAENVRDFNFSASPYYKFRTEMFRGIKINYWYRNLPIDKVQMRTRNAVARFEDKVGEYPYDTLTIGEVHSGATMESPQMIWLAGDTPGWNIAYLVTHELGHQWFYGVVGNNQPLQPFADESINDFITRDFLGFRNSKCATDSLDKSIYDYQGKCYYETIYVGGSKYINAYRNNVGNANFWSALQAYYQQYKFKRASTRDFWDFMDAHTGFVGGHADRFPTLYP